MKATFPFARILRLAALAILVAGVGTWVATGRHVGWTQTSAVSLQRDEITGIEYPVRREAFVAGVEVPALAAAVAAALAAGSWFAGRRAAARA